MALQIMHRLFTGDYDSFEELEDSYLVSLTFYPSQQDLFNNLMLPCVLLDCDVRVFRRLGFRFVLLWRTRFDAKFVCVLHSMLVHYLEAQRLLYYIKQLIDHGITQDRFYLDAVKTLAEFMKEQTDRHMEPSTTTWPPSLLTSIAEAVHEDEAGAQRYLAAVEKGYYNCNSPLSTQRQLERRVKFTPIELIEAMYLID